MFAYAVYFWNYAQWKRKKKEERRKKKEEQIEIFAFDFLNCEDK